MKRFYSWGIWVCLILVSLGILGATPASGAYQTERFTSPTASPTSTVSPVGSPITAPTVTPSSTPPPDPCREEEPANDQPPGTLLTLSVARCGHIDRAGDRDQFWFQVKSGRTYRVVVTPMTDEVDPVLEVTLSGRTLRNDDRVAGDLASELLFTATSTATAQAVVNSNYPLGSSAPGQHLYSILLTEYDPSAADPMEALEPGPLLIGEVQTRAFDPEGDVDQAVLAPLLPGRRYAVTATSLVGASPRLTVVVGGVEYVNDQAAPGSVESRVEFVAPSATIAWIRVENRNLVWGPTQRYTLQAREVVPPPASPTAPAATSTPPPDLYEPDNEVQPPLYLVGAAMARAFDSTDDVDFASLSVKAGAYYDVVVEPVSAGVDPYLELFLWNGQGWTLIAQNDDQAPGDPTAGVQIGPMAVSTAMLVKMTNRTPGPIGDAARYRLEIRSVPPPTPTPTAFPTPGQPTPVAPVLPGNPSPPLGSGGPTGAGGSVGSGGLISTPQPYPTIPSGPIATPEPPPTLAVPEETPPADGSRVAVRVIVYVDENLDGLWQPSEGATGVPVQVLDGATGLSREWQTGKDGVALFTAPPGATVIVPLLGQSQTIQGASPVLLFKVNPLTLPGRLP